MTDLRKAAQQALEAMIEHGSPYLGHESAYQSAITALHQALAEPEQAPISLNEGRLTQYSDGSIGVGTPTPRKPEQPYDQTALDLCKVCGWRTLIPSDACLNCERSKQPEQEPVAWMTPTGAVYRTEDVDGCFDYTHIPLYAAPTPRKPLTEHEILQVLGSVRESITGNVFLAFARAIERAHGIGGGE